MAEASSLFPPPPDWFAQAIVRAPTRAWTQAAGARIETLSWGEEGRPGLLFLHGNGAHADWWRFIAPFFVDDWRVGALSWSGMGRSDWRAAYSLDLHVEEMMAAAQAIGLFRSAAKPWIVAHSFGSGVALMAAASALGERFAGLVIVDSGILIDILGIPIAGRRAWTNPGYATLKDGMARFRLRPEQRCDNDFLLDFIARHSLTERPDADGSTRWHWNFDPSADTTRGTDHLVHTRARISGARCPLAFIWGDRSKLMLPSVVALTMQAAPAGTRWVEVPDAGHHLMLDQPLAFVAALRALLPNTASEK